METITTQALHSVKCCRIENTGKLSRGQKRRAEERLNGLIACGVPEDWSVHDIGHELTAFHGIDHARTLAIVQPGLWKALREEKKEKLLQYGERVWKITEGSTDEKVDAAIEKTVEFFESLGIKTRLSEYGVGQDTIDKIVARFRERNWINLGDRGLTTPEVTKETLEHQLPDSRRTGRAPGLLVGSCLGCDL